MCEHVHPSDFSRLAIKQYAMKFPVNGGSFEGNRDALRESAIVAFGRSEHLVTVFFSARKDAAQIMHYVTFGTPLSHYQDWYGIHERRRSYRSFSSLDLAYFGLLHSNFVRLTPKASIDGFLGTWFVVVSKLFCSILKGLYVLHKSTFAHGDVKCDNVMWDMSDNKLEFKLGLLVFSPTLNCVV